MFPKRLKKAVICNTDEPVVQTKYGRLRGLITDGTYVFRGVRYAKARRFHMPEEQDTWEGIKNAISFAPVCPEESTPIAHDQYYVPHYHHMQNEDCQFLNIWTGTLDQNAKKPVMVWIHGGLFDTGSSIELYAYDGEELSNFGDVVVVSVSHRLNILGYLDLSAYGEEYRYSGNSGTADLVAALEWIRDNIISFGGDPDNVTLFGQSGGGQKMAALLQTPAADGLYHRIIIESGMSAEGHRPGYGKIDPSKGAAGNHNRLEDARILASYVLEELGLTPENVSGIEDLYYYEIARAGMAAKDRCRKEGIIASWCPTFDNEYYLGDAMANGFRKETLDIPVIIGSNLGEFSGNATHSPADSPKNSWDPAFVEELIERRFGENAKTAAEEFRKAYPDHPLCDLALMDDEFRKGVMDFARIRYDAGSRALYTYMFSLEMPYLDGTLPWHNCEEAYVLHNAKYLEASYIPEVSENMQDMMSGAWAAFARTGNPNHAGMPVWEPYDTDKKAIMIFDRVPEMRYGHDEKLIMLIPDRRMGGFHGKPQFGGGPRMVF